MPNVLVRPYQSDERDLPAMLDLVRRQWLAAAPSPGDLHPGDLLWQRFMHEDHRSRWFERVLLWEKDDQLQGFAIFYPKRGEIVLCLDGALEGDIELVSQIVESMRNLAAEFQKDATNAAALAVSVLPGSLLEQTLRALGGRAIDEPYLRMNGLELRSGNVFEAVLPEGWMVRPVAGPDEFERRVAVHQAAFSPSKINVAAYARMREVPGYDPALDLVAVGPGGAIGNFALGWFDAETGTGLIEPVGASPAYRRRGLTRAVLMELLRRFQTLGATWVYVNSFEDSAAAVGLYESAGFRQVQRWRLYAV